MKRGSLQRTMLVLTTTFLLTGCASNGASRYQLETDASQRKGAAEATVTIPPLAKVCYQERPHADLRPGGEDLSSLAAREGDVVNLLNQDKRDCAYLERKWRKGAR